MKYHVIDNSLKNLGKTVLWQYDRAVRLLSVMKHMQVLYHCAVEQFWDFWTTKVLSIDTCGALGCSIWGIFLGVPRPTIVENGKERLIVSSVYRRLLKGAFYLMKSSSSFEDILGYLEIVFGIEGEDNLSKWSVYVSEYGWTTNIEELNSDTREVEKYYPRLAYKKGIVFFNEELGSNWKCLRDITAAENTSFDALREVNAVVETIDSATTIGEKGTLLLKLYDPEGICRKIGGAPANSLTISVAYEFGETTITAVANRNRKCGITLMDNGDMSMTYGKSEFYDDMHRDQKYLFEQKIDECCPFPLGIRSNDPIPEWVLGCKGQENEQYQVGKTYEVGSIFGYADTDGTCYNYICKQEVSARENTSFDAIRSKLDVTKEGDPFVGGLVEMNSPSTYSRAYLEGVLPRGDLYFGLSLYYGKGMTITEDEARACRSFYNTMMDLVDISSLFYVALFRVYVGNLCIIRKNGMRYIAVVGKPSDLFFFDGDSTIMGFNGDYIFYSSPKIMNFQPLVDIGNPSEERAVSYYMYHYVLLSVGLLRDEIERCLGIIASRYQWKIIGEADSRVPIPQCAYQINTAFRVDGQDVYLDNKGNYPLLSRTTIACDSTLSRLK